MSDTLEEQTAAHSPYGPSAAEGWSTCLDYVNANRGLPDDSGEAAAEGTFAHAISDECLALGMDAADFIGHRLKVKNWTFTWTEDDASLLQPGIDRLRSEEGEFFGEQRVDISKWTVEGQFGTLDRALTTSSLVTLEDLKWGRGVPVHPTRNKQLVLYALGLWEKIADCYTTPPEFLLRINQPRCSGGGGEWRTTLDELVAIGTWLRERAQLSSTMENPPRTASESGCMWCRRKNAPGGCDTYETWRLETLGMQFEDLDRGEVPMPSILTPERRAILLRHKDGLERWLDKHEEAALVEAKQSGPACGLKAVVDTRKGSREKWRDEEAVAAVLEPILGDQSFTKKLITPLQARKKVSPEEQEKLTGLTEPGTAGYSLVPEEDARPAYQEVSAEQFDDL